MTFWLMMPCWLIVVVSIVLFEKTIFNPSECYLFSVKVPRERMEDPQIVQIKTRLRKKYKYLEIAMAAFVVGGFFIRNYPIILALSMFVWMFGILGLVELILIRGDDEVYRYKREQLNFGGGSEDGDQYWRGSFYKNPNDPKLFVEKRMGIGLQLNDAHLAAKVIYASAAAIIIGLCVWLAAMIPLDFPSLHLKVDGTTIQVDATQYNQKIDLNQVERAEIRTKLPRMYKNEGYSGQDYEFGQYRLKEIGQCKVYINETAGEYLILYTADDIYVINSDDEKDFQACVHAVEEKVSIEQR